MSVKIPVDFPTTCDQSCSMVRRNGMFETKKRVSSSPLNRDGETIVPAL